MNIEKLRQKQTNFQKLLSLEEYLSSYMFTDIEISVNNNTYLIDSEHFYDFIQSYISNYSSGYIK